VADNGDIFIVYDHEDVVVRFSSAGEFRTEWPMWGTYGLSGEFSGIALSGDGRVFLSDTRNSYLRTYSSAGDTLAVVGRKGTGPGQFLVPLGLTIDGVVVYVADSANRRVQKLSRQGAALAEFYTESPYDDVAAGPQQVLVKGGSVVVIYRSGVATYEYR
jgi:hypothetical protein